MKSVVDVRIQLGPELGPKFAEYWNREVGAGSIPESTPAEYYQEEKPAGGPALSIPPEVIIDVATWVAMGIGGAMLSEIGKVLWKKLQNFFTSQPSNTLPQLVVIVIGTQRVSFDPRNMPENAPSSITTDSK